MEQPQRFESSGTPDPNAAPACVTSIFSKTCGGSVCHDKGSLTNDLDLRSANVATRLINVQATHAGLDPDAGTCAPAKYIDTANPAASWLLVKINGAPPGNCGVQMPQIGTLTSTNKACITGWVQALAADAGTSTTGGSGGAATGGSGGAATAGGSGGAATAGGSGGTATAGGSGGSSGASSGGSGGASASGTGGA